MSRRTQAPKRTILPDPKFNSQMLAKFMNMVMNDGKKSVAERIVYGAIDRISTPADVRKSRRWKFWSRRWKTSSLRSR